MKIETGTATNNANVTAVTSCPRLQTKSEKKVTRTHITIGIVDSGPKTLEVTKAIFSRVVIGNIYSLYSSRREADKGEDN